MEQIGRDMRNQNGLIWQFCYSEEGKGLRNEARRRNGREGTALVIFIPGMYS